MSWTIWLEVSCTTPHWLATIRNVRSTSFRTQRGRWCINCTSSTTENKPLCKSSLDVIQLQKSIQRTGIFDIHPIAFSSDETCDYSIRVQYLGHITTKASNVGSRPAGNIQRYFGEQSWDKLLHCDGIDLHTLRTRRRKHSLACQIAHSNSIHLVGWVLRYFLVDHAHKML